MRYQILLFSLFLLFGLGVKAQTAILTDPISMTADDLVGGDTISFSKNISVVQDPAHNSFQCWVKIGSVNYDATNGKDFTLTSGGGSFDLVATFPKNCINGNNVLTIEGTIPTNAHNSATYSSDFKLAITYNVP